MNHRIEKLQRILKAQQIDYAFYASSSAVQYLLNDTTYPWQRTVHTASPERIPEGRPTGHFLNTADAILAVPVSGEATLVMTEERAKTMHPSDVNIMVGFYYDTGDMLSSFVTGCSFAVGECCNWYLKELLTEAFTGCSIVSGEEYVEDLRKNKEPEEVDALRKAAAFTDRCMEHLTTLISPEVTSRQLQHAISDFAREHGADISFPPAAIFIHTDRPGSDILFPWELDLPMGERCSVGFDYGFLLNGYVSDYGRSLYCGQADEDLIRGYHALNQAQVELIDSIRPGMRIGDCFGKIYAGMERHGGYGKYLRRSPADIALMGHQIGIDTHERPWVRDDQDAVFEAGMVLCIEPKLWMPGKCYCRCEDMVYVSENGAESLTKFDREKFCIL